MKRGSGPEKMREWTERLHRFEQAGLTVGEFCLHEGVSSDSFYSWKRELRDAADGSSEWLEQPCSKQHPLNGSRRSTNHTKHAGAPAFRAVRLMPGAATGSCLTVRLPGGAELIVTMDSTQLAMLLAGASLAASRRRRKIAWPFGGRKLGRSGKRWKHGLRKRTIGSRT